MKIGITERGDAALDLSWINKIDDVDGAVLITKNCSSRSFIDAVRRFRHKVIVHCTITGYGGSFIEPYVPSFEDTLKAMNELVTFLKPGRVVLRIDPIIPNDVGRTWIPYLINNMPKEVKRVRFSIIDNYPHLRNRGFNLPWETFHAPANLVNNVVKDLTQYEKTHSIECCGESYDFIPQIWRKGCISDWDLILLGLDIFQAPKVTSNQRKSCKCLSIKTELLSNKRKCQHGCLYCYWK